jgi:SAM-dependent methyltransferase
MPTDAPVLPSGVLSSDHAFDSLFDEKIQKLSGQHWTPVRIAARAASLLAQAGATRVLDIGSGIGKFCIVGALTTDAEFVGVERRGRLVAIARSAAASLGVSRATFVHANVESFPFHGFNGVYLYNPFYEQIAKHLVQIDGTIERSALVYIHFVRTTLAKLAALAPPAALVTFNGFGGYVPLDFEFLGDEPAGSARLEIWVKR